RFPEAAGALDQHFLLLDRKSKPSAEAYRLRGLSRAKQGDYAAAIDDYTEALHLKPDAKLHALRGRTHLTLEALPLAEHDFEAALDLDPDSSDAYSGLGYVHAKQRRYAQAAADAEKAAGLGRASSRLLYNAARVFAEIVAQMDADPRQRSALGRRSRLQD